MTFIIGNVRQRFPCFVLSNVVLKDLPVQHGFGKLVSLVGELEGEEGLKYIEEYSDGSTERGKLLRKKIAEKFNFASLKLRL